MAQQQQAHGTGVGGKIASALGLGTSSGYGPHKILINVQQLNNLTKPPGDRKLEPYLAFTLNGEASTRNKTKTLKQGSDFQGNECLFNTEERMSCDLNKDILHVELWNDAPIFSKDNLLGESILPLRELLTSNGQLDRWVQISPPGQFQAQKGLLGQTGQIGQTGGVMQQQQQPDMMAGQQAGLGQLGQQQPGFGQQQAGFGQQQQGMAGGLPSVHLFIRVIEGLPMQQQQAGMVGQQQQMPMQQQQPGVMPGQQQQYGAAEKLGAGYPTATSTVTGGSALGQQGGLTGTGSGLGSSNLPGQQRPF